MALFMFLNVHVYVSSLRMCVCVCVSQFSMQIKAAGNKANIMCESRRTSPYSYSVLEAHAKSTDATPCRSSIMSTQTPYAQTSSLTHYAVYFTGKRWLLGNLVYNDYTTRLQGRVFIIHHTEAARRDTKTQHTEVSVCVLWDNISVGRLL